MKKSNLLLAVICITTFNLQFLTCSCSAQYARIHDFNGIDGSWPRGSLISDGIFLYGMTPYGGTNDMGLIFKIKSDGTEYNSLFSFDSINGSDPLGSLVSDGNFLYGMTRFGGTNNMGLIFKIKTDGTSYSKLYDFTGINGRLPYGSLIYDGNFLYGMTQSGGMWGNGVVFKIKPDGTGDTVLLNLGFIGGYPQGSLVLAGGFLYGMTSDGGTGHVGTIIKLKPDGSEDTTVLNFAGANGAEPFGDLISDGTFLYGMTAQGGSNNFGTIFKIMPDGTGYSRLFDFDPSGGNGVNGKTPKGSLVSDGSFLYGATTAGGAYGGGVLFKIKPDGTMFTKLIDFGNTGDGGSVSGSLIYDGNFLYGMTYFGGAMGDYGTIFKYALTTGITENNQETNFIISPNPFSSQTTITFNEEQKNISIKIMDVLGRQIKSIDFKGRTLILEKGEMKPGIYFLQISDEIKHVVNRKIVVE